MLDNVHVPAVLSADFDRRWYSVPSAIPCVCLDSRRLDRKDFRQLDVINEWHIMSPLVTYALPIVILSTLSLLVNTFLLVLCNFSNLFVIKGA